MIRNPSCNYVSTGEKLLNKSEFSWKTWNCLGDPNILNGGVYLHSRYKALIRLIFVAYVLYSAAIWPLPSREQICGLNLLYSEMVRHTKIVSKLYSPTWICTWPIGSGLYLSPVPVCLLKGLLLNLCTFFSNFTFLHRFYIFYIDALIVIKGINAVRSRKVTHANVLYLSKIFIFTLALC